jgi:DNA primase large subunit
MVLNRKEKICQKAKSKQKQSLKKLGERQPSKEKGKKLWLMLSLRFNITLAEPADALVYTSAKNIINNRVASTTVGAISIFYKSLKKS